MVLEISITLAIYKGVVSGLSLPEGQRQPSCISVFSR